MSFIIVRTVVRPIIRTWADFYRALAQTACSVRYRLPLSVRRTLQLYLISERTCRHFLDNVRGMGSILKFFLTFQTTCNWDSTSVRLPFNCNSTTLRRTVRRHRPTLRVTTGMLHCSLNKETGQIVQAIILVLYIFHYFASFWTKKIWFDCDLPVPSLWP